MKPELIDKTLTIAGMHCNNCEMRIESALRALPGVIKARANYNTARLLIKYDPELVELQQIIQCLEKLDYAVEKEAQSPGHTKLAQNNNGKLSSAQLLGIAVIFLAAYLVVNNTFGFAFLPQIKQNMGYGLLFVVGLITSVHCLAMCGGINISQCTAGCSLPETEAGKTKPISPSLMYNLGRVTSYTIIGGLAGGLGSIIALPGSAKGLVAVIVGILMAIMGLNMLNIFPGLRRLNPRMPKRLSELLNRNNKNKRRGPFYIGLLNGLMPCGPLQAMQLYALGTGSAWVGALSMLFFSLGTVPLMFGLGAVTSFLGSIFKQRMLQVSGVLVMLLGILILSRGLNLSGINLAYASPEVSRTGNIAVIEEGESQVVETTLQVGRYQPIVVQKGIPVRWTIKADARDLNGCNNPVTIPKYNRQKELVPGDNVIEFTPQESGKITYTCWMGMITSTITVVDDISNVTEKDLAPPPGASFSSGGCCAKGTAGTASDSSLSGCCGYKSTSNGGFGKNGNSAI
jgi:sulfite exporter TauE/SafE/copper chaperone CopZ